MENDVCEKEAIFKLWLKHEMFYLSLTEFRTMFQTRIIQLFQSCSFLGAFFILVDIPPDKVFSFTSASGESWF